MSLQAARDGKLAEMFVKYISCFKVPVQSPVLGDNIYNVPVISDSQIKAIQTMLKDGVSVPGCCKFLSNFDFDPAIVNGIGAQPDQPNGELYLLANSIAWVGSEAFWTVDYFILITNSLVKVKKSFSGVREFCLKLVCVHFEAISLHVLPTGVITHLSDVLDTIKCRPSYIIVIIFHFLRNAKKTKNEPVQHECIRCLARIITENDEKMIGYDFTLINREIDSLVEVIDLEGLCLLAAVSDVEGADASVLDIWRKLVRVISEEFDASKRTEFKVEHPTPCISMPMELTDFQVNFSTFQNFPIQRETLSNKCFDGTISPVELLTERQFHIMSACQVLTHRKVEEPIVIFLNEFSQYLDSVEKCYCFLMIIEGLENFYMSTTCVENLLKCGIFSPEMTVFYEDNFGVVGCLRNRILKQLYEKYRQQLSNLQYTNRDSILYIETIVRLHLLECDVHTYFNSSTVVDIARLLQTIVFCLSVHFDQRLYTVWSTLFFYAVSSAENPALNNMFFSSLEFTSALLQHLWHKPLQNLIFTLLRKYLTQPDSVLGSIANFSDGLLRGALVTDDERYHAIAVELVESLEGAMKHKQDIVKELSKITPSILSFLLKFPTKDLLNCTMDFLLLVSFNCEGFSFSHKTMLELGETIRFMEKDGLSETTMNFLMSLIAGNKNTMNSFIIRNPSFILLILNASSDDISDLIANFYELCKFSIYNCIQCHKSEIDMVLIQLLYAYPRPFKFMDCMFHCTFTLEQIHEIVIPFLSLIFTYSCSPQTVERFIGLIVPVVDGRQMSLEGPSESAEVLNYGEATPPIPLLRKHESMSISDRIIHHPKMNITTLDLDKIGHMKDGIRVKQRNFVFGQFADKVLDCAARTLLEEKTVHFTFSSKAKPFLFDSISFADIEKEFSYSCYVLIDQQVATMQRAILFKLTDSEDCSLTLDTNGISLLCEIAGVNGTSSVSLTSTLPSCEWIMITISLVAKDDNISLLYFSINKENVTFFTVKNPHFQGPNVHVQVGGFRGDSVDGDHVFCFLGRFILMNKCLSSNADVAKLYSCGPKMEATFKDLLGEHKKLPSCYIDSFSSVFRQYNIGVSLLPAFAFINTAPPFFIEKIVDMLRFAECDQYFPVVSQFLMQCNPQCLTYSLYFHFFTLFTESVSSSLFNEILLNFEIWYACQDPMHVRRIVNHWNQVLFEDFSSDFINCTTFGELVGKIRIFFWFTKDEPDIIANRRSPDLDIVGIREVLNRLLIKFAATKLSQVDVKCLLDHIQTTLDVSQKLSFLSLLGEIVDLLTNPTECVSYLHSVFETYRADLFSLNLKTVLLLTKREEVNAQVELIQALIHGIHYRADILDSLCAFCDDYPELLTLACRIAVNLGGEKENEAREKLCSVVESGGGESLIKMKTWYVWPVIMLLRSPEEHQERLTKVICSVMMLERVYIDEVLAFIDMIGVKHHFRVAPITYRIMKVFCEDLSDATKNISRTFYRCSRYLLFQFGDVNHSEALIKEFQNSPYYSSDCAPLYQYSDTLNVGSIDDIADVLNEAPVPLSFRIHVDEHSLPIFWEIIGMISAYLKNHEIRDTTLSRYLMFFQYLSEKKHLSPRKRFETIHSLSSGLWNSVKVMDISFNGYVRAMRADMLAYIKKVKRTKKQQISSADAQKWGIHGINMKRLISAGRADNMYRFFKNQYMNSTSIWRCFRGNNPPLKKTSRLLDNFTSPMLKNQYKRFKFPMDPVIVKGMPVLQRQARLINLEGTHNISFAILIDRIIIAWKTQIVILTGKDIKMILYRSPNAYEFVTNDARTYLVAFQGVAVSDLISALKRVSFEVAPLIQTTPFPVFTQKLGLTMDWLRGKLSNFDYIMRLNYFGGRSSNCLSIYPVFPLVENPDGSLRQFTKRLEVNPRVWVKLFVTHTGQRTYETEQLESDHVTFYCEGEMERAVVQPASKDSIAIDDDTRELKSGDESLFESDTILQVLEKGSLELTPEFYCMPEAFSRSMKYSEYRFVYDLRKRLESDDVTNQLHIWLDNVFGPNSRQNCLFKAAHPQKKFTRNGATCKTLKPFDVATGNVTYASIEAVSENTLLIHTILDNALVHATTLSWEKDGELELEVVQNTTVNIGNSVITTVSKKVVLLDAPNSDVCVIGPQGLRRTTMELHPTDSCNGPVCLSEHGVVYCLQMRKNELSIFGVCKLSPESPVCADSSSRYNITAVGVRSGRVLLFERSTGHYIREIANNGESPKRVAICTTFPFVVIQYSGSVKLYSIYGSFISEARISFEVSLMTLSQSRNGLDHIFLVDTTGRVLHMEPMSSEAVELIRYNSRILALRYIDDCSCVLALTQEGRGLYIHCVI